MKYVNHTHEAAECIQKCSNSNEEFRKLVTAVVKSAISVYNYTSLSICQIQIMHVRNFTVDKSSNLSRDRHSSVYLSVH